jgi:hypothetical protein
LALANFDKNCSLWIGPALSDAGLDLESGSELQKVYTPGLLLAFLSLMVADNDTCLEIEWADFKASISMAGIFCDKLDTATVELAERVVIRRVKNVSGALLPVHSRAAIPQSNIKELLELAGRTYAPASEASRLAGAGAGLSDND